MEEWNQLMNGNVFITDLGGEHTAVVEGVEQTLGRYAVWSPVQGGDHHAIVEVGSDLSDLMQRYHVPRELVCTLQTAHS